MYNDDKKEKQTRARKEIKKIEKKYKNGYLIKLYLFRIIVILICCVGIFYIVNNIKWGNDKNQNNMLNTKDINYNVLLETYNRNGEKEDFEKYIVELEKKIAIYLITNTTVDNNSFENITKKVENILNSDNWNTLGINKNNYYKGSYILNVDGNLKFKFKVKNIEPNWAKDCNYIITN